MVEDLKNTAPLADEVSFTLLEGFLDPVILVDDKRQAIYANLAAKDVIDTLTIGRDLSICFRHPETLKSVDAVLDGKGEQIGELDVVAPVLRTFEFHVRAVTLFKKKKRGAILALRDITSLKSADQMRRDFVANVSHELRSPISSLVGIIETLQGSAKNDPHSQKKFLKIMSDEAARMSRLIDDLLSLSRVEVTEHVLPDEVVNVKEIMEAGIELLGGIARKKNIIIDLKIKSVLPHVFGDRDELMEVFQNLIDNAIKYGDKNSQIEIIISSVDKIPESNVPGIKISFKNQGDGIETEHLPRLTERFYRADKARSRNTGGTGLGLAIVKHIVNRHRGHLSIESEPGETTSFTVFLPVASET